MLRSGGRKSIMAAFGLTPQTLTRCVVIVLLVHVGYLYFTVIFRPDQNTISLQPETLHAITRTTSEPPDPKESRIVNKVITEYDADLRMEMRRLVKAKAREDDPRLLELIRKLLDPPSNHIIKTVRQIIHTPQSSEATAILQGMQNGFFVECGALDGERSSNTLYLEQRLGWTGLLVEMDPYFYTQLRGKARRSWSINACLSPYDYPTVMEFRESSGGSGTLLDDRSNFQDRQGVIHKVPCFPFRSLMLALNQSRVDFFSLDVEGFELEILQTVPFQDIDIKVLAVEYAHGRAGKDSYRYFMDKHGYKVHRDIHYHDFKAALFVDDFIFVKNDWNITGQYEV